jgi:DnaK suppressor protein
MEGTIMRQRRIQFIRRALVRKMEELRLSADNTISRMKDDEGNCADPFDQAATDSIKFVELACRDRERELMIDVKETIMRIDRGLFGVCDHCGRMIHDERLSIEPMSRLCTECQDEKEISHKRKNRRLTMKGMTHQHG